MSEYEVLQVNVDQIVANCEQPRLVFDDEQIQALAQSIKENGLIQPITVRYVNGKYEIIAGERRFRACVLAGLTKVPVHCMVTTDYESAVLALVENIQRVDLSSIEEAKAYVNLMQLSGMSQVELAKKVGKSQSAVANKIRLLQLDPQVQQQIIDGKLSERHGRALLAVDKKQQVAFMNHIVKQQLTVAQSEQYIASKLKKEATKPKGKVRSFNKHQLIAINTIKQSVDMVNKSGFNTSLDVIDDDEYIELKIRIKK